MQIKRAFIQRKLNSNDPMTRKEAALTLGQMRDRDSVEPLIKLLKDTSPTVQGAAATALGEIADKRAIDALVEILSNRDWNVRKAAADALEMMSWEPGDDRQRLDYAIASRDWLGAARFGLVSVHRLYDVLKEMDHLHPFFWASPSERDRARVTVIQALGQTGISSLEILIEILLGSYDTDRKAAEAVLVNEIREPAIAPLVKILNGKRSGIDQAWAAAALARFGSPGIEPLALAFVEGGTQLQKVTFQTLQSIGWYPQSAVEKLCWAIALERWDEIAQFGSDALDRVLRRIDEFRAEAVDEDNTYSETFQYYLLNELREKRYKKVVQLADILGNIGDDKAIQALVTLHKRARENISIYGTNAWDGSYKGQNFDFKLSEYALRTLVDIDAPVVPSLLVETYGWNESLVNELLPKLGEENLQRLKEYRHLDFIKEFIEGRDS